jgi:hypothetical protein
VDIRVNEERFDAELDQERILGEVVSGLTAWFDEHNYVITGADADGEALDLSDPATWTERPVEDVGRLSLWVSAAGTAMVERLSTSVDFFKALTEALRSGNEKTLTNLNTDLEEILEALPELSGLRREDTGDILELSRAARAGTADSRHAFADGVDRILVLIEERLREATNPLKELKTTVLAFRGILPQLEDISVSLQTGKNREAIDTLLAFTALSQKMIRLYGNLKHTGTDVTALEVGEESFDSFYRSLNGILRELLDAYSAEDTVQMGDLLEYEVVPRIENLVGRLETIDL